VTDPFTDPQRGCPYYLRPQDPAMEVKHLALLNEAERLERVSASILRGERQQQK
jgi:hypothetical protein